MTYERAKIGICIPTAGLIRAECTFSLMQLIGVLAQGRLWPETREQSFVVKMQTGSGIAKNRENMVDECLAADCTHVCFVDDDMKFEVAAFVLLAQRRLPIVGTNYRKRVPPAHFTAVHLDRARGIMQTTAQSSGLEPCDYMGFGLSLIEARVFAALRKPYFLNQYRNDAYTTEDLPFYYQAREAGFIAYVDHDASKQTSHMGSFEYRWEQQFSEDAHGR